MANVTITTTQSSFTRAVNLDWRNGAPVGVSVSASSSSTFSYTIQTTLDDLQLTTSQSWVNDPSATALTSNSSGVYVYTAPIAAIRINSTTLTSGVLTFKVNQAEL